MSEWHDCDCGIFGGWPHPANAHVEKICEDCGGPGISWEDGVIVCTDCAILRAKRSQMRREGSL